jgi:hypothetical protein
MGSGFRIIPSPRQRPVVDDVMLVRGPLPQVVRLYFNQTGITSAPQIPQSITSRKNSGKIVMISKRSILQRSTNQKSFRRVDYDRLPPGSTSTTIESTAVSVVP